ncbi:Ras-related protein Rab-4B [Histomonas meleagridis]|uniref:Ras-related protein Rab-4B n=1 Tax=Histomonas meleagridis TaxID=135588 RepID=UPI003559CA5E|nr:Ras-related protein Rab-4B [Histomonas meleagridis]KAH0798964.1 Ras-related protein Rab-4B [Histomonas meleagridis]
MVKEYNADYRFKVCIIGAAGSGKTAMVDQYLDHEFHEQTKTTVGVDYRPCVFSINEYCVQLELWDTAGQETYQSIAKTYFRGAKGCILVFDITEQKSFDELSFWLGQFRQLADPNASIILVGNKADLEDQRQVTREAAEGYATSNMLDYLETSAVSGQNIGEVFDRIAHQLFNSAKEGKITTGPAVKVEKSHHNPEHYQTCVC